MPKPFPPDFVWGTATAAHQIEGNNVNSDCWALEHAKPSLFAEPSGDATDSYHRFAEDVEIVASLGLDAYRFSIEWARIEPEDGFFSEAALAHYQRCVAACLAKGLKPVVTFHHFTLPRWLTAKGGFAAVDFPARFAAYCEKAARSLDGMAMACTINELNLPLLARGYFFEQIKPDAKAAAEKALGGPLTNFFIFADDGAVLGNGIAAHRAARSAIKTARPGVPVGMTLAISEEAAEPGAEAYRDTRLNRLYVPFLDAAADDDFVGVQNYTRTTSRADGSTGVPAGAPRTTMGYEDRPQALGEVCRWIANRWKTPMYVTENGFSGDDDARRAEFISQALDGLAAAIASGADIRGYFYWSLLDNFEWLLGYRQRFGLVSVDRATQKRQIKDSAKTYASLVRKHA
ncbi:MAG TPA: family 1 glycosylhydrolase [Rhizomicrobium sp.]|jgi:beta-glucosidase